MTKKTEHKANYHGHYHHNNNSVVGGLVLIVIGVIILLKLFGFCCPYQFIYAVIAVLLIIKGMQSLSR